ncbi:MAG: EAL domain-containing protein [Mariprofundaceae bacterium]|nr:EAL domain-containing protein [Mariprofundaceae bacterium]
MDRPAASPTEATAQTHADLEARLAAEQVGFIYQQLPGSLYASLAVATVLIIALWNHVSHPLLASWAGAYVLVTAWRLTVHKRYIQTSPAPEEAHRWCSRFMSGAALAGVIWGAAGYVLMPPESPGHQILVILVLAGVLVVASQSLAAIFTAFVVFSLPTLLPAIAWLLQQNTPLHLAMAMMVSFFLVIMILLARGLNSTLSESFRLRFENIDLVAQLETEISHHRRSEAITRRHNTVLKQLANGEALSDILKSINDMIEEQLPETISSILMLDESGRHLYTTSAPRLPRAYNAAIDGTPIGPAAGSCGTAAWHNKMVIVEDIATDPLWKDYRDLALAHDLKACWSMPIRNSHGKVIGTFALYYRQPRSPGDADIALIQSTAHLAGIAIEHMQAATRMEQLAHTDPLTGLPNRALFMDRFSQALARARRRKQQLALLFVDLDRFKPINDTLGHEAGDQTLKEIAGRMLACVREMDTVARLGGDEFTILLTDVRHAGDAATVARKIRHAISRPIELQGKRFELGCSIGISLYPKDGEDVDTLLKKADTTMYRAKESDSANICFYTQSIGEEAIRQLDMERDLRRALNKDEFELHYQLIISLDDGQIAGMEALLRWNHPEKGLLMPDVFIPLAEKSGLIVPIGEWVLAKSCAQREVWQEEKIAGETPVAVNITMNISALQLNKGDLAATVRRILDETGLPPACLELEISESSIMTGADRHMDILQQLKALGVHLTIDNFGTGFSSLDYLGRFPIDSLKIDRSIITGLPGDKNSVTLVTTMIHLAHNLGIRVMAEGVENTEQLEFLRSHGCDEAQGFLLHRPAPAGEMADMLRGTKWQQEWQRLLRKRKNRKGKSS